MLVSVVSACFDCSVLILRLACCVFAILWVGVLLGGLVLWLFIMFGGF